VQWRRYPGDVAVRPHLLLCALLGAVFPLVLLALWLRPAPGVQPLAAPPDHGLPYSKATFTATAARRAFAASGIALSARSRTAAVTTLGNRGDVLEVDAFGDRHEVERSGFYDYTVAHGRRVHFARSCSPGGPNAERWRGNVRVIVDCMKAGAAAPRWLRRVDRALERL
jgi:hypothetical protein